MTAPTDERIDAFLRGLTADQLNMLLTPLNPNRVKDHKGNAHLEAWDVRRWLTRIFGFGGWTDEILSMDCVHSVTSPIGNDPAPLKHRCTAVYRVTMRLTIKDQWGNVLGHWDDGATGEGVNQVSVGDAHDLALKAALSQALKRCAVNLGDQFGLSLYNKGDMRGVVVRTLGHPVLTAPTDAPEDAPVVGGELDEQHEEPAEPATAATPSPAQAPAEDAWNTEAGRKRMAHMHALISQKYGPMDDARRHAGFSKFVRRTITSAKQLTFEEVDAFCAALRKQPDFQPGEQPPPEQAGAPQQSREQYSAELESRLLARINAVATVAELDEAWSAVQDNAHLGALTPQQEQNLTAAMNRRESELKVGAPA